MQLKTSLINSGYCVNPEVVSPTELPRLLAACRKITEIDDGWAVPATAICSDSTIADLIFSDTLMQTLVELLGPAPVLLPSVTVRKNLYVDWHIDAAFRGDLGGTAPEPNFLQLAVYLQDNHPDSGGGLDVIPGSHKRLLVNGDLYSPAECLDVLGRQHRIPSRAGDLVVWDARLLHASASPRASCRPQERYGIFLSFARNSAPHHRFVQHLRNRAMEKRSDGDTRENRRYADALELKLPEDFTPRAAAVLRSHNVRLAAF